MANTPAYNNTIGTTAENI